MPTSEIVLEDANKPLFRVITFISTGQGVNAVLGDGRVVLTRI
jgi:hypothetical protein